MSESLQTSNFKTIHPEYKIVGFDGTSRVYSGNPSLSQIPKILRHAVIPHEGNKFMYVDLKAAEVYILCKWAKCQVLIEAYENGQDLYTFIAQTVLHKQTIDKNERDTMKVVVLSILYGSEGSSAARALHITEEEAKALLDNYIPDTGDEYLEYHIFYNTVSYLVKHDKYTKDGTAFVFKESDIKDFIQTYFNRDNFDYQSEGMVVTKDSSNQTVKVEVNFALFGEGEGGVEDTIGYKDYKTIKNFTFENGVADFIYSKKIVYNEPFEIDGKITSETNWNYKVKLIKVNGKLRVKESLMLYN